MFFTAMDVPLIFMETIVRLQAERKISLLLIQRAQINLQSPACCNKAWKPQIFVQVARAAAAFQRVGGLFSSLSVV